MSWKRRMAVPRLLRYSVGPNGRYPTDREGNEVLVYDGFYSSDGIRFRFWLQDPGNCRVAYRWDSDRRTWEVYDTESCAGFEIAGHPRSLHVGKRNAQRDVL
jgi:hypothetical protein